MILISKTRVAPSDFTWSQVFFIHNDLAFFLTPTTELQLLGFRHYLVLLYFCWAFALFHQGIVIIVTFKILHSFLLKRQSKRYKIIQFCILRNISKLSLINKLILLESSDKIVKSSKFMLPSQVNKWSEAADC